MGVGKQAQRIGAEGVAGIIDKALALADIGDGLFLLRGKIFGHRYRKGGHLAAHHMWGVGDRTIGIVHDAHALTRAAQRSAVACAQRRPRCEGRNGLGADIRHPGPQRCIEVRIRAHERERHRDVRSGIRAHTRALWNIGSDGDIRTGRLPGEQLTINHRVDNAAHAGRQPALW